MVLLEGVLQLEELRGREGGSYPLGLPERLEEVARDVRTYKKKASNQSDSSVETSEKNSYWLRRCRNCDFCTNAIEESSLVLIAERNPKFLRGWSSNLNRHKDNFNKIDDATAVDNCRVIADPNKPQNGLSNISFD